MPERFRYLTKEVSDPSVKWPWFVALAFLVCTWRAVLFELSNWRKAALAIIQFVGYLLKFVLALIFHFIGDPITSLIRCLETAIYSVRAFCSGIVAYSQLTLVIALASAVLAIAEATVPNAISSQPYLLTLSGLIGYAAVGGHISEPFFWTLLLAVLAAVGEPWVSVVAMALYLALVFFIIQISFLKERKKLKS